MCLVCTRYKNSRLGFSMHDNCQLTSGSLGDIIVCYTINRINRDNIAIIKST